MREKPTKFVGFSRLFLQGILIFEWLTARRLHKSFGVKGLTLLRHTCNVQTRKYKIGSWFSYFPAGIILNAKHAVSILEALLF
jgi:hypothetical protein